MYTNLNQEEIRLLDTLNRATSIPLLHHQLKNPLREGTRASVALAWGLISKSTLFTQEMGLGKTFTAMALAENILRADSTKKVLFCGTNDKLNEYIETFEENLSPCWKVKSTTASKSQVKQIWNGENDDFHILISTHSIWDKGVEFHKEFLLHLNEFQAFILDEGGMVLGNIDNYAFRCTKALAPKMKYKFILNATPINDNINLLINQCIVLGIPIPSRGEMYSKYCTYDSEYKINLQNLDVLKEELKYHIFNMSRNSIEEAGDVTYTVQPYLLKDRGIKSGEYRFPFSNVNNFRPDKYPILKLFLGVCFKGQQDGDKILVYVRNVEPKKYIKQYLEMLGLKVGIYDGTHTDTADKKREVENCFNAGEYDVLLTNKIYGLSLHVANHLIIYDFPPDLHQFIFRGVRDLKAKHLKLSVFVYDTVSDYETLEKICKSEQNQNQFLDRGFFIASEIKRILNSRKRGDYDG